VKREGKPFPNSGRRVGLEYVTKKHMPNKVTEFRKGETHYFDRLLVINLHIEKEDQLKELEVIRLDCPKLPSRLPGILRSGGVDLEQKIRPIRRFRWEEFFSGEAY